MSGRKRRRLSWTIPAALVLAACSGQAGAPTSPQTQSRAASGPATPADEVRVGLSEWTFTTSSASLTEGTKTLRVTNAGSTPHDLQVLAGDRVLARTATLLPGQQQTIEINLADSSINLADSSRVTFLCTLPGHRSQGMVHDLPVVAAVRQEGSAR